MIPESHKTWPMLASTALLSLATVNKKGEPHCSVVVYDVDKNLDFIFATDIHSMKAHDIEEHSLVAFAIVSKEMGMTVQGSGKARLVKNPVEKTDYFKRLLLKAEQAVDGWAPIARYKTENVVIFKIKPDWLRLLDISTPQENIENLSFEQLK